MNHKLQNLSELVARACDVFDNRFHHIDTLLGVMDKALRHKGVNADAITIDCIALDKKIVILIHDDKPDVVSIALGNKKGELYSSSEYELATLSEAIVVEIMAINFIS